MAKKKTTADQLSNRLKEQARCMAQDFAAMGDRISVLERYPKDNSRLDQIEKRVKAAEATRAVTGGDMGAIYKRLHAVEQTVKTAIDNASGAHKLIADRIDWIEAHMADSGPQAKGDDAEARLEAIEKALECQREGKHEWERGSVLAGRWSMMGIRVCSRCKTEQTKRCWTARGLKNFWDGKD